VRYAEVLQRAGDPAEAIRMLETTLELYTRTTPELPGWLCGRLAALYRALKRYDDEVVLLERYRESQSSEDARTRFDARLSKARAIAERKRRTETRALSSVRRVINGREDGDIPVLSMPIVDDGSFPADAVRDLRDALTAAASNGDALSAMAAALGRMSVEARGRDYPPERIVSALKEIWRATPCPPHVGPHHWEAIYRLALARSLALYFDESYP
jgi:hypothetical protein